MTTYAKEYVIQPASGGFGEWDSGEGWRIENPDGWIQECAASDGKMYELGVDDLPEEVEDIRGLIHNQPERIFARVDFNTGEISYHGANGL